MSAHQPNLAFEGDADFGAGRNAADEDGALVVDLDGFEGPLHLLLELARRQKVDLMRLSIAKLADQYLAFVVAARRRQFSLAADYLVMAAWLAYLKSRLLLPRAEKVQADEPPAEMMAAALAARLRRLHAVRQAGTELHARPQLGRDVFLRGDPDAVAVTSTTRMRGDLHALVHAYAAQCTRTAARRYAPQRRVEAYPLEAARERLRGLLDELHTWTVLEGVAPAAAGEGGPSRASCLASTLAAGLEMVKEGALEARQRAAFDPIYLKARLRA